MRKRSFLVLIVNPFTAEHEKISGLKLFCYLPTYEKFAGTISGLKIWLIISIQIAIFYLKFFLISPVFLLTITKEDDGTKHNKKKMWKKKIVQTRSAEYKKFKFLI